jgi:hypothetical protein
MSDEKDLIDVMVSIMRTRGAGTRAVEKAAEVIAADARFNTRVGAAKSHSWPKANMLPLIEFTDEIFADCKSIAAQFKGGLGEEELCRRLAEVKERLDQRDV